LLDDESAGEAVQEINYDTAVEDVAGQKLGDFVVGLLPLLFFLSEELLADLELFGLRGCDWDCEDF
jgi:hypothetical protein